MKLFGVLAAMILAALVSRPTARAGSIISEARLGASDHDAPFLGHHRENGVDINIELLFRSPPLLRFLLNPRPDIGVNVNSDGNTSALYGGLTWTTNLTDGVFAADDPIFIDGQLGGAVHNGKHSTPDPGRKSLGSQVLFHEGLDLGYLYAPAHTAMIFLDHMSNAGLARRNEGITDLGLRLGWVF